MKSQRRPSKPPGSRVWPTISMFLTEPPPPVPSTRRTIGSLNSCAIISDMTSFSLMAPSLAPPRTVKSSPATTTRRPSMRPRPITRLAGVNFASLPSASYSALPASVPISWNDPGSSRPSTRSRTVSLPPSCWRLIFSGPPMVRPSFSRLRSSSISGFQLIGAS